MNNIFNLNRFGRLFIKHTAEHYRSYLMSLSVLLGVMILGGCFIVYMIDIPMEVQMQLAIFTMVLVLAGTIFTSTVFADIGDNKSAITSLTLPASHFEKYLVAWLYSYLFFLVIYTACFYMVMLLLTTIKHFPGQHTEILNIFYKGGGFQICLVYAFLHSVTFCGAIFFEKLHFIKTAFIFFIGIAILIIGNNIVQQAMLGRNVVMNAPFGGVRFMENNKMADINITGEMLVYNLTLLSALSFIFWTAAFFRLKEKQV
ncbi:MAG: hypothetical protein JWP37_170 [Mucilaginibacter sp.]|nr:hypothetical protein [Mucilaginibacter sp.]